MDVVLYFPAFQVVFQPKCLQDGSQTAPGTNCPNLFVIFGGHGPDFFKMLGSFVGSFCGAAWLGGFLSTCFRTLGHSKLTKKTSQNGLAWSQKS